MAVTIKFKATSRIGQVTGDFIRLASSVDNDVAAAIALQDKEFDNIENVRVLEDDDSERPVNLDGTPREEEAA